MPSNKVSVKRRSSRKYALNHPEYVLLHNRRMCHIRKLVYEWIKNNQPELLNKFRKEANKKYPNKLLEDINSLARKD
jgi:hypothetical protein